MHLDSFALMAFSFPANVARSCDDAYPPYSQRRPHATVRHPIASNDRISAYQEASRGIVSFELG